MLFALGTKLAGLNDNVNRMVQKMRTIIAHPLLQRFAPTLEKYGTMAEIPYDRLAAGGEVYAFKLTPHKDLRGTVLFVHGTGNDAAYPFLYLFLTLLKAGFAVMSFDLDGHGRFSKTVGKSTSFASCLASAMAKCQHEFPDQPHFLFGHSLGGALALHYMRMHPHKIRGAVILSTPCVSEFSWRMMLPEIFGSLDPAWLRQCYLYGWLHVWPAFGPFGRRAYPLRLDETNGSMGYVSFVGKQFQQLAPLAYAPAVKDQVLCIYGENDWIAPAKHGNKLASTLAKGSFKEIPRANHFTTPFLPATAEAVTTFYQSLL